MEDEGYSALTAEAVARQAGVSRRTFFNYFKSVNDALNHCIDLMLHQLVEAVEEIPEGASVIDFAFDALQQLAADASIDRLARLHLEVQNNPSLRATALASWDSCRNQLTESIVKKHADQPSFEVSVWVHVLLGACMAAFHRWGEELDDPRSANYQQLQELLNKALSMTSGGIAIVNPSNQRGI